jgi:hypothetical protein
MFFLLFQLSNHSFISIIMRTSIISAVAVMAMSAEAAKSYIPYVWNNTAPAIDGQLVQAINGLFNVGGTADGKCSGACPSANKTVITQKSNDDFWLNVADPQGQQMYVFDQELKYTLPKTDKVSGPDEQAINGPFSIDFDDYAQETVLRFQGNDWAACKAFDVNKGITLEIQPLVYGGSLWANAYNWECTPFKMRLEETDAPAVDYYRRDCPFRWLNCCPFLCMGQTWAIVDGTINEPGDIVKTCPN